MCIATKYDPISRTFACLAVRFFFNTEEISPVWSHLENVHSFPEVDFI